MIAPPDSWIERRPADVYGLTTDDAGFCPLGHNIDAGECDCDEGDVPNCTCPISADHCTC